MKLAALTRNGNESDALYVGMESASIQAHAELARMLDN
jgi:hypothetical protein